MRTGKELILASKTYTKDNTLRSWVEVCLTLLLLSTCLVISFMPLPFWVRIFCSIFTALFYVRIFVIYHDYQHHAILQKSFVADLVMKGIGLYLLTPQNVWKRTHDHHHSHNSKLTMHGIGSYPTISKEVFLKLSKKHRLIYLLNRHPAVILLGYFTLFIYWLNIKSFSQSPRKHWDSCVSLLFHVGASVGVWYSFGAVVFWVSWFLPFLIAFGIGSYLFYCQHNFPGAQFFENQDWKYEGAALLSTSFMVMNPLMQWFTGNIGFHHVHHLNSRIPFYRLPKVMREMPELQHPIKTSWHPADIWQCFALKMWDGETNQMITIKQLNAQKLQHKNQKSVKSETALQV